MSRATRLLSLLQALRRYKHPVTASKLAIELDVSERTIYRDVASLIAQGAPIYGEAGIGYILQTGFFLPPLMFSEDEIEAVVLGLQYVGQRGDKVLTQAATEVLAKIGAALPSSLYSIFENPTVLPGPSSQLFPQNIIDLGLLRSAIRNRNKIQLVYIDANNIRTDRVVWPIALGFLNSMRVLVAKCELRQAYRYFLTHRIQTVTKLNQHYPGHRTTLLKEWKTSIISTTND